MNQVLVDRQPTSSAEGFVGRNKELAIVEGLLGRASPQHCNVVGEPFIGVTSFLQYICSQKIGAPVPENSLYLWVPLVEMSNLESLSFWRLLARCYSSDSKVAFASRNNSVSFSKMTAREIFECIDEDLGKLKEHLGCAPVVFALDNAEFLVPSLKEQDLDWLRAMALRHKEYLAFVMGSTDHLYSEFLRTVGQRASSSIFATMYVVPLGLFSEPAAELLINGVTLSLKRPNLSLNDVQFLLQEAGSHPTLLKFACERLLEAKGLDNASRKYQQEAQIEFRASTYTHSILETLFSRRKRQEEREALSLISLGKGADVDRIMLRRLRNLGLIKDQKGTVALFSEAFKNWLDREGTTLKSESKELLQNEEQKEFRHSPLNYLPEQGLVKVNNETRELTELEGRLMRFFWENANRICSTKELLENVWGHGRSESVVEKAINRLRVKVESEPKRPSHIVTVKGRGYIFYDNPAPVSRNDRRPYAA